ncbi:MAG: SWIM zinc finger family protein [Candidatus Riflebacteria bacterium]|nr:SWIM zinc finger family protein [Candidatus Riflebacteria bacterium]
MGFWRRRGRSRRSYGYGYGGSYEYREKEPAPKDGVKASGASSTWWGKQWIVALERLGGYSNRLPRGVTYAREGRVRNLKLTAEGATAGVVGTMPTPYTVTIRLAALTGPEWSQLIQAIRSQARHITSLLAGKMPDSLQPEIAQLIFPRAGRDLETHCSCPDYANPCKHVAAVHYVLAEALDRDPFLLFQLRGKGRQALLDALGLGNSPTPEEVGAVPDSRVGRAGRKTAPAASAAPPTPRQASPAQRATETPAPSAATKAVAMTWDALVGKGAAALDLHFHLEAPRTDALILEQLGQVPGASELSSWEMALTPTYRKVGETALLLGLAEPTDTPTLTGASAALGKSPSSSAVTQELRFISEGSTTQETQPVAKARPGRRRLGLGERVTALLRKSPGLTALELGEKLDVDREALKTTIKSLLATGAVVKKGRTRGTTYSIP